MPTVRVTKKFEFEAAHALHNYDGKCRNMHGHTYKMQVTIKGGVVRDENHKKNGMVMDFGDLKKIVKEEVVDRYDHSVILNSNSPLSEYVGKLEHLDNYHLVDYQPTCENMVVDFAARIKKRLPEGVELYSIQLYETSNSFAEWFADDN